jgi:diaminohydroxyphosphoribosylaminopyrimidine deaminase/5-amino-6-(5-phosphoribosylamino)uracil reductase
VLAKLASLQVNDLLVEAGATLAGAMLAAGHVDELVIYQAPHIMGSATISMFNTPTWTDLADRKSLEFSDVRRVGNDTRITATIRATDQDWCSQES